MQTLHSFLDGDDGALPAAGLLVDKTGALYGTTQSGGAKNAGTVFKLTTSGSGYTESVAYAFAGGNHDGAMPLAGLIEDASGALFGTTAGGGFSDQKRVCSGGSITGCGTVFRLTPSGSGYAESLIYRFRGVIGDGISPFGGLVADKGGRLYGTTYEGGTVQYPGGTVFQLSPSRNGTRYAEKILLTFAYSPSDPHYPEGLFPTASLLAGDSGVLFGTTEAGSSCPVQPFGCGVVFALTPSQSGGYTENVLYAFQGGNDGWWPLAGLIADKTGALYGSTEYGGPANLGTVFKLTPAVSGYTESVLYAFHGADGALPVASLILDRGGALYGTTSAGGTANQGTVFKLSPAGPGYSEQVLYAFQGGSDGADPVASLTLCKSGTLCGTTMTGGTSGVGTVFALKL